jgi:aarF domain-containing kinase
LVEKILTTTRKHGVHLEGGFSTLLVGTIVLEGLGRQLDPDINFLEEAVPFLPSEHKDFRSAVKFLKRKARDELSS